MSKSLHYISKTICEKRAWELCDKVGNFVPKNVLKVQYKVDIYVALKVPK